MIGFSNWLTQLPEALEAAAQRVDRWFSEPGSVRWFGERSLLAFCLPIPSYFFIVMGPAMLSPSGGLPGRGPLAWVLVAAALGAQVVYFRSSARRMAWLHLCTTGLLAVVTYVLAAPGATTASPGTFQNSLAPLAVLMLAVAVVASHLLRSRFGFPVPKAIIEKFKAALQKATPLPPKPRPRQIDLWGVLRAYAFTLVETPLHLLIVPGLAVVLVPQAWMFLAFWAAFVLSLMLFAAATYDPDRDTLTLLVTRAFLSGGALFVTLGVMLLAVLRLLHVDYVTTVLAGGSKGTIVSFLLAAYSLLWFHDFWVRQRALDILYELPFRNMDNPIGNLRRHGGGRIAVIEPSGPVRVFAPGDLLGELARADHSPELAHEALAIDSRLRALVALTTALTLAVVTAAVAVMGRAAPVPLIDTSAGHARRVDLAEKLIESPDAPVILLAASGGGTRAALWTAAVLHGLALQHQLARLSIASGVSGGSAALAYFALHRQTLLSDVPDEWKKMQDVLAAPYIDDVLAGSGELRLLRGTRHGQLLAETFQRRFATGSSSQPKDLGLVLNASICASEQPGLGGGRLIITNVDSSFFPGKSTKRLGWTLPFPVVAIPQAEADLFAAAAASANFPPVFPDALVNTREGTFWVTDGGAVENRGVIELLLLVNEALEKLVDRRAEARSISEIRIVVAEASALDRESGQDRGVGAALHASTQLANRLVQDLLLSANDRYKRISNGTEGVRMVYLPMPDVIRSAGAFGTHWMMPPEVPLGVHRQGDKNVSSIDVPGDKMRWLIDSLLAPGFGEKSIGKNLGIDQPELLLKEIGELPWGTLERGLKPAAQLSK